MQKFANFYTAQKNKKRNLDRTLHCQLKQGMSKTTVTFRVNHQTAKALKAVKHGYRGRIIDVLVRANTKTLRKFSKKAA